MIVRDAVAAYFKWLDRPCLPDNDGGITGELYKEVAVDLHHVQLPKLAEWGIVDYDTDTKLATVAQTLRPLDEYLRLAEQHDRHSGQPHDRS